jgi:hypothetical protein
LSSKNKIDHFFGTVSSEQQVVRKLGGDGCFRSFQMMLHPVSVFLYFSFSLSLDSLGRFNIPELTYLLMLHYMQLPEKQKKWIEKQIDCVLSVAERTREQSRKETPAFTS